MEEFDKIIVGGGFYGLYSALFCGKKHEKILVLEKETKPFLRATYVNQARVHQGYHYPRSLSTAIKSAYYFDRFNKEFSFCVNKNFKQIYAISSKYSWTNGEEFESFCNAAKIPCERINAEKIFNNNMVEDAFITQEYTYDAKELCEYLIEKINKYKNIVFKCKSEVTSINRDSDYYYVEVNKKKKYKTKYILNTTYASSNQIINMLGFDKFNIKYEKCEIILCKPSNALKEYGITVMDGPFFSIMPFGKTNYHSLTSVTFTPHETCFNELPIYECQNKNQQYCNSKELGNCNSCIAKPNTSFSYMNSLIMKYLKNEYSCEYIKSLFSIKPILMSSEIDDSRPTVIKKFSNNPTFISVLSGKINTVYDLEEILDE